MNITKITIIFFLSGLLLCACNGTDKVTELATDFLNSYLSTDYAKAAKFCTSNFSQSLLSSTEELNSLDQQIKDKIKEHAKKLKITIGQIEKIGKGDTLMVNYSLTGEELPIESSLCMVKIDNTWQVAKLNR